MKALPNGLRSIKDVGAVSLFAPHRGVRRWKEGTVEAISDGRGHWVETERRETKIFLA